MKLQSKKFMTEKQLQAWKRTLRGRYFTLLQKHPFWMFGLPFISMVVGSSFALSTFTALRYERHDEKVKLMSEEEALQVDRGKRKVSMKDEYYRLQQLGDLDDWEQVRVPRRKGESENVW